MELFTISGRTRITASLAVFVVLAMAATTANSFAATQIGNSCVSSSSVPGMQIQTASPGAVSSYVVPTAGVITSWGTNVITYPGGITGRLAVFRPAATAGTYTVVGVSSQQAVLGGANSFPTRIPVSGGEQIAMSAPVGSLNCLTSDATDVTAATTPPTDLAAGSTITTGPITTKSRAAVTATIEPDADQDGYGDETQDLCPISAAYQIACPIVKLVKFALPPTASSLKLLLTSSAPAPVSVSGVVAIKLPKSGKKKAKTTKFKVSAALPTVSPGSIATITVKFPKKLTAALKQFSSSQKFKLKLTIVGTGVANVDTSVTTVTLRGTK